MSMNALPDTTKRHIMTFNTLIEKTQNYSEFHEKLQKFDTATKGVVQELFARQYFLAYAKLHDIKRYYARTTRKMMNRKNDDSVIMKSHFL